MPRGVRRQRDRRPMSLSLDYHIRRHILLIDDDPQQLEFGRVLAERAGYTYTAALGGREGLRQAHAARPDVILLDYVMPDLNGRCVFDELRRSDDLKVRHTPVIMLTGQSDNRDEQRELLNAGLAAYLYKPFGYHELLNVIDNVLVLARAHERNRVLERQAQQSFVATARMLVTLLFAKDRYTGEHSNMTADLAEVVALNCGLSEAEAGHVKLGALLHDIGKIGVPEHILCKPTQLTADETIAMRLHVDYGEQALCGVPHMEAVREMVSHHHEWWDGGGYPRALRGERIPLGARIIAAVDAFDAMTSDRPYRRRLDLAEAIRRLRLASATQFDPFVVDKLYASLDGYDLTRERSMNLQFLDELSPVC